MIVQCKEEDVEKNGYPHADWLTDSHVTYWPSPVHCTGLGKNWNNKSNWDSRAEIKYIDSII